MYRCRADIAVVYMYDREIRRVSAIRGEGIMGRRVEVELDRGKEREG